VVQRFWGVNIDQWKRRSGCGHNEHPRVKKRPPGSRTRPTSKHAEAVGLASPDHLGCASRRRREAFPGTSWQVAEIVKRCGPQPAASTSAKPNELPAGYRGAAWCIPVDYQVLKPRRMETGAGWSALKAHGKSAEQQWQNSGHISVCACWQCSRHTLLRQDCRCRTRVFRQRQRYLPSVLR
jgi:hypothetical protein